MTAHKLDTPQPTRQGNFKLGKLSRLLILLTLLLPVCYYTMPMAKRVINKHYGKIHLEKAKTFSIAREWQKAGLEMKEALRFLPDDAEVLRELVKLLDQTNNHGTLMRNAVLRLRELKADIPSDLLLLTISLYKEGQLEAARESFMVLDVGQRESALGRRLNYQISLAVEGQPSSENLMHPDVKTAIAQCRNPFPEFKSKGTSRLWQLSEATDERSLQAINYLATSEVLTRAQIDLLIERLNLHPNKSLRVLLHVYSSLMRNFPDEREITLKKLASHYKDAPLNELRIFLQWLSLEAEPKILRSLVSEHTLNSDPAVFTAYLESFTTRGQWSDILSLFDKLEPHFPINPESVAFYRGKAWIHLEPGGPKASEQFNLALQISRAAENSDMLLLIGKEAAEFNLAEISQAAYTQLSELKPNLASYALQQNLIVATRKRDTNSIVRIVDQLSKLNIARSDYTAQLCYLRLLQGANMETLPLPESNETEQDSLAFLKAFRAYRFNDPSMIQRHLSEVSTQVSLSDGQKAIYAGLLFGVGQTQKASQIADELIPDLLLPEEKMFLERGIGMSKSDVK